MAVKDKKYYLLGEVLTVASNKQLSATGSGAIASSLAPGVGFRLNGVQLHFDSAQTQDTLTITCNAGRGAPYDTLLYSRSMVSGAITDLVIPFGVGYEFAANDVIDVAYTGTDGDGYGLTFNFQVLPVTG